MANDIAHRGRGRLLTRSFAFEVRATGDDGTIEGYGSVFNNIDSYDDVIVPGAFQKSIDAHRARKTMPAMLWQHDASEPIGKWDEAIEDERGLKLRGRLALATQRGRDVHEFMKFGAIDGLSIGFMAKQWAWDRSTEIRTLTEIDLWEVSLVTFPANDQARVTGVKAIDGMSTPKDAELILRDAGFSKSGATAFVSAVQHMGGKRREADATAVRAATAAGRLLKLLQQ